MQKKDLIKHKQVFETNKLSFYTDLFSKAIWGDMGEDCASVYITVLQGQWHLHFIRTESGEPYPLSDTVCTVIDEYEKDLSDDEFYDYLLLHGLAKEFESFINF